MSEEKKDKEDAVENLRVVYLCEEIKSSKDTIKSLIELEAKNRNPITLILNSGGGNISDGFAIHDMIKFLKSKVYIIVAGESCSMSNVVLCSVPVERRSSLSNSEFMVHEASWGAWDTKHSDFQVKAERLKISNNKIYEILGNNTNRSAEEWKKLSNNDYWFDSSEALSCGLVGSITGTLDLRMEKKDV